MEVGHLLGSELGKFVKDFEMDQKDYQVLTVEK